MAEYEEPPNGTALYWPESHDLYCRLVIRDDRAAAALGSPTEHWFAPNSDGPAITWDDLCTKVIDRTTRLEDAIGLTPGRGLVIFS